MISLHIEQHMVIDIFAWKCMEKSQRAAVLEKNNLFNQILNKSQQFHTVNFNIYQHNSYFTKKCPMLG